MKKFDLFNKILWYYPINTQYKDIVKIWIELKYDVGINRAMGEAYLDNNKCKVLYIYLKFNNYLFKDLFIILIGVLIRLKLFDGNKLLTCLLVIFLLFRLIFILKVLRIGEGIEIDIFKSVKDIYFKGGINNIFIPSPRLGDHRSIFDVFNNERLKRLVKKNRLIKLRVIVTYLLYILICFSKLPLWL